MYSRFESIWRTTQMRTLINGGVTHGDVFKQQWGIAAGGATPHHKLSRWNQEKADGLGGKFQTDSAAH